MSAPQANEAEKNIEIWKVKKLIKRLSEARGNGTSMISLVIRASMSPFAVLVLELTQSEYSPERSSVSSRANVG